MLADPVPRHAPALPVPRAPNARHSATDLLDFIRRFMGDHGYAPSVREIARACGMSTLSVAIYQLRILERAGRIERDRYVGRGIRLIAGEDSECDRLRAQLAELRERHARLTVDADALRKRLAMRGELVAAAIEYRRHPTEAAWRRFCAAVDALQGGAGEEGEG